MILHVLSGQIKDPLIAPFRVRLSRNLDHPVRMAAVEITVHIDHLRLHPDSKIHANRLDLICNPL